MTDRLYADIHVLQTVPPSCVNRDDTGSPKTAVYGGVTRARVSSQAWKKAVRDMFRETLPKEDVGVRTKRIQAMVANELSGQGYLGDAGEAAKAILEKAGLASKSVDAGSAAPLFFMSPAQAKALARLVLDDRDADKKAARGALNAAPSIDIALFGRMVADDATLNIDASCQVAHAISTHRVQNEFDYFTAVDDFPSEDKTDAGAAMMGTVEYNSSTLYRYATVAVHELRVQLGDADTAANAVKAFTDAFTRSMPNGKINTFANRTPPDAVYVALRTDRPLNLVGAFELPVAAKERGTAKDQGYVSASSEALVKKANDVRKWALPPAVSYTVDGLLNGIAGVEAVETFDILLDKLGGKTAALLR
ncbi:MAG: type I-E CRISPR-associated protein Cas7/Cse4/CasC [Oscillospiraceae bacterium]|jgi:CRISPR system Cascade subunit CasC|nr:type I-E CRISPR-associated protein Cas7/Cse4/CasC [Oscillospiraceae bacterium]